MQLQPAVFLDRDGVLIASRLQGGVPHPPPRVEMMEILPGVAESLRKLSAAGYNLLVVTNQPDVARGRQTRDNVEQINAALQSALPIEAIYVCYHDDADRCDCRKPAPGMLTQAAREHGIDLSASFMVGDRWSDVVAGAAAGCRTFLISRSYSHVDRCMPDHVVADLSEAAERILLEAPHSGSKVSARTSVRGC
jgi:D-glycero-D-manno-heptose 1,7-bisphosphate phosphatase